MGNTTSISFRVNEHMAELVDEAAHDLGIGRSEYLRQLLKLQLHPETDTFPIEGDVPEVPYTTEEEVREIARRVYHEQEARTSEATADVEDVEDPLGIGGDLEEI